MPEMLFDDSENGGEAQAGTLALFLGGEERLKYFFYGTRVHAHAIVRYGKAHVMTGRDRSISAATFFIQIGILRFDQEMAAVGHSVAGIEAKVQQDLFDLRGIRPGGAKIGCQRRLDLDLLASCALQQCHGFGNDFVNI